MDPQSGHRPLGQVGSRAGNQRPMLTVYGVASQQGS